MFSAFNTMMWKLFSFLKFDIFSGSEILLGTLECFKDFCFVRSFSFYCSREMPFEDVFPFFQSNFFRIRLSFANGGDEVVRFSAFIRFPFNGFCLMLKHCFLACFPWEFFQSCSCLCMVLIRDQPTKCLEHGVRDLVRKAAAALCLCGKVVRRLHRSQIALPQSGTWSLCRSNTLAMEHHAWDLNFLTAFPVFVK